MPSSIRSARLRHRALSRRLFVGVIANVICALPVQAQRAIALDTVRVTVGSRVTSSMQRAPRSLDVITRDELAARSGETLAEILATRLGVDIYTRSPAQADLALRGSSIEQVLVLVNGVPVSDEQAGHFDLDLAVPMDMIDHVEILRGTGSTLYGADAVGGVINIVTAQRGSAAEARIRSGSFGTVGAALTRIGRLGAINVQDGVAYAKSDGQRSGTDYRLLQARGGADARLGAGHLAGDVAIAVRDFGAADFYSPFPSYEDTHTSTASLRYDAPLGDRWSMRVAADARHHVDLFTLERDNPALYQNHHDNWQTGSEAVFRFIASPSLAAAIGGEGYEARLVSARLGDHDETRSAAFVEVNAGRLVGPRLDAGLRVDHSSAYGDFASPSLAVAFPFGSRVTLRASVDRGFRAPTWTERFYTDPSNIGTANLRPEHFWAEEIGVTGSPSARTRFDVAVFTRQAADLIDWARPAASDPSLPWRTVNFESAQYRGIEVMGQAYHMAGADWTLRASGLAFVPQGASGYEGKYALRPITRTLGSTVSRPLGGRVTALIDLLEAQRAPDASYARADMRLVFRQHGMLVTTDLRNLTDARYLDASGMPVAGRSMYVGLGWTIS